MELTFNKVGDLYIAEATVSKDYALHVEKDDMSGYFSVKQRSTSEGNYGQCVIPSVVQGGFWKTLDWVFAHGFYPMSLQFVSSVPITKAELNEVTE